MTKKTAMNTCVHVFEWMWSFHFSGINAQVFFNLQKYNRIKSCISYSSHSWSVSLAWKIVLVLEMQNLELSQWFSRVTLNVNLEVRILSQLRFCLVSKAALLEGQFSLYLETWYLLPLRFFILVWLLMSKIAKFCTCLDVCDFENWCLFLLS